MLQGVELREGLVEVAVGDVLIIDVEAVEDRLVEHAALLVVAAPVEFLGILQQLEAGLDELGAVGEIGGGGVELLVELASPAFDVAEFGFDLRLREGAVCC
ncbi:hypothetical protein [Haloechinothrix salitolerans]|uniref:Uncharacterized protein n=1 Tax=Haloechinothrix salitolerans TaxID=926830 RepID=A0ABW2BXA3_9PSEU